MADDARASLPAELARRFELEGELGQGASSVVFRARDRELGRSVAIKLHRRDASEEFADRFLREAEALARLRHPNLIQVYSAGRAAGQPYLVMELVEGRSLADLEAGEDPLAALLDVASALEALHAAELVHRDVKPTNVMVEGGGRGVLMDLGCVHDPGAETLTSSGVLLGTGGFLPPEAFRGAFPGPSWDWHAWGASLYYLHFGELPFSMEALLRYAGGAPLPPLEPPAPWPTPGVERAVRACLGLGEEPPPTTRVELEAVLGDAVAGAVSVAPSVVADRLVAIETLASTARRRSGRVGAAQAARGGAAAPAEESVPEAAPRSARGLGVFGSVLWAAVGFLGFAALAPSGGVPPGGPAPSPRLVAGEPLGGVDPPAARGPLLLPDPSPVRAEQFPALCLGEERRELRDGGWVRPLPPDGLVAQLESVYLTVYDRHPFQLRGIYRSPRRHVLFPRAEGGLWVVSPPRPDEPASLALAERWEPWVGSPLDNGCHAEPPPFPGDAEAPEADPVVIQGREAEPGAGTWPALALGLGAAHYVEIGLDAPGTRRRVLFGRDGAPPSLLTFPDDARWKESSPLRSMWGPWLLLVHRRSEGKGRVLALDVRTGEEAWRLEVGAELRAPPLGTPRGLFLMVGDSLRLYPRALLDGVVTASPSEVLRLPQGEGWLPPLHDWSRMAWSERSGLHLWMPHAIPAARREEEVPVLSWYALGDADPQRPVPAPRRLRVPRPPPAFMLEQQTSLRLIEVPERPSRVLVTLTIGWTWSEALLLDVDRGRIVRRLDTASEGELGRYGVVRTKPLVSLEAGRPRAYWIDSWGRHFAWWLEG